MVFEPALTIFVLALIIFIVPIVWALQERDRALWRHAFAKAIRFSFAKTAPPVLIFPLRDFALFGNKMVSWHADNLISGEMDGVTVQIFDFTRRVDVGRSPLQQSGIKSSQTVVVFTSDRIQLPHFSVRPKNVIIRNHPRFGEEHLRHRINQRFAQAYFLQGEDETAVRALFDGELCEHYGRLLTKSSEGKDNTLIYYYEGHLVLQDVMDEFLEEAMQTFNLFAAKSKLVGILKQNNQLH